MINSSLSKHNPNLFRKRKLANTIGLALSISAMVVGMLLLIWILTVLFYKGFSEIHLQMFTANVPAPGLSLIHI